ncbi:unnamed protein product [Discula destructiva]
MSFLCLILSALMCILLVGAQTQSATSDDSPRTITTATNDTFTIMDDFVINLKINDTYTIPIIGTIQDAFDVLSELDPVQANSIKESIHSGVAQHRSVASPSTSNLTSRSEDGDCCTPTSFTCNAFTDADCLRIAEGISYLNSVSGSPAAGPAPLGCGRVSCSYNSAIWWCNNNTTPYTLDSFSLIANGAQQVMDDCSFEQYDHRCTGGVNGEQWYSGNWVVLVKDASC